MSTPFHLLLPRQLYSEMLQHAQLELPNECCGLFAGKISENRGCAEVRYPLVNELASPVEFNAEPRSLLAAFKDMRVRGIHELAIYHSHPSSPPIPSKKDLARSYGPGVVNLIISCSAWPPLVRAWWLGETDFSEASFEIID